MPASRPVRRRRAGRVPLPARRRLNMATVDDLEELCRTGPAQVDPPLGERRRHRPCAGQAGSLAQQRVPTGPEVDRRRAARHQTAAPLLVTDEPSCRHPPAPPAPPASPAPPVSPGGPSPAVVAARPPALSAAMAAAIRPRPASSMRTSVAASATAAQVARTCSGSVPASRAGEGMPEHAWRGPPGSDGPVDGRRPKPPARRRGPRLAGGGPRPRHPCRAPCAGRARRGT